MRREVYEVFAPRGGGRLGRFADWFILLLIAANVLAVMLETVEPLYVRFADLFDWFETVSVAIFTVEYVARLWTVVEDERYARPVVGRLRYAVTFFMVIDLLAILPFYLAALGFGFDLRFLRALRLLRLFRLFKMGRYFTAANTFMRVLKDRKEKLVIAFSANLILLIVASSAMMGYTEPATSISGRRRRGAWQAAESPRLQVLSTPSAMYIVEHEAQPETFPSIPATMWWGVVTLTTVGYGDIVPVTRLGQLVGAVVAVLGIGMFALPAALIATGFAQAAGVEEPPGEA
jgi:voltage-gated potassium channel